MWSLEVLRSRSAPTATCTLIRLILYTTAPPVYMYLDSIMTKRRIVLRSWGTTITKTLKSCSGSKWMTNKSNFQPTNNSKTNWKARWLTMPYPKMKRWKKMLNFRKKAKRILTSPLTKIIRAINNGLKASQEKTKSKKITISINFMWRAYKATKRNVKTAWEQKSPTRTLSNSRWRRATRECKTKGTRAWIMIRSIWRTWVLTRRLMRLCINIKKPSTRDIATQNWPRISSRRPTMTLQVLSKRVSPTLLRMPTTKAQFSTSSSHQILRRNQLFRILKV